MVAKGAGAPLWYLGGLGPNLVVAEGLGPTPVVVEAVWGHPCCKLKVYRVVEGAGPTPVVAAGSCGGLRGLGAPLW